MRNIICKELEPLQETSLSKDETDYQSKIELHYGPLDSIFISNLSMASGGDNLCSNVTEEMLAVPPGG